jgi:hypothetical protein
MKFSGVGTLEAEKPDFLARVGGLDGAVSGKIGVNPLGAGVIPDSRLCITPWGKISPHPPDFGSSRPESSRGSGTMGRRNMS